MRRRTARIRAKKSPARRKRSRWPSATPANSTARARSRPPWPRPTATSTSTCPAPASPPPRNFPRAPGVYIVSAALFMDDAERLLVEAAQRDPARFGDLYDRHFERVYAFVARRVRDRDAAEDVTADVFQRALAALPAFEWRGAPFAVWLLRIAANALADRF